MNPKLKDIPRKSVSSQDKITHIILQKEYRSKDEAFDIVL